MRFTLVLLTALLPAFSFAGGFQLNTEGLKGMSIGGAYTAISADASSVFYNPGAMSFNEKSSIIAGIFLSNPKTNYLSPYSGNIEAEDKSQMFFNFYVNYKIAEKLSAGIGINAPFGHEIQWADSWEGRYVTQQFKFKTIYIQPTVSYKINDYVGVGIGLEYAMGNFEMRRAIPVEGSAPFGNSAYKAKANGIGINAGLFVKVNEETRLGLSYRKAVKFDFKDGDVSFTNLPSSLSSNFPATSKFTSALKTPSIISAAIAYNFTENLIATVQLDFMAWSSFDSLNFIITDHSLLDIRTGRNANNCMAARVGAQYHFTDNLDVRIGTAYEQTPVPTEYLSPEFPDANKIILTLGAGFKINEKLGIDLAVGAENYFERKGKFIDANFNGSFKSNNLTFGLALNYNF